MNFRANHTEILEGGEALRPAAPFALLPYTFTGIHGFEFLHPALHLICYIKNLANRV